MAGRIASASVRAVVGRKKPLKAALTLVRISIELCSFDLNFSSLGSRYRQNCNLPLTIINDSKTWYVYSCSGLPLN